MSKIILLIGGLAGSGKDTCADYIVDKYHYSKTSFADEIKKLVMSKYELEYNDCYTQEGKQTKLDSIRTKEIIKQVEEEFGDLPDYFYENGVVNLTPRYLLILEGLEARKKDINTWGALTTDYINSNKFEKVVIPDFRFPNEYTYLKQFFEYVYVIKVIRDSIIPLDNPAEKGVDDFKFDFTITNNGNKEELYKKLDNILSWVW